jgi:hypothetical protein
MVRQDGDTKGKIMLKLAGLAMLALTMPASAQSIGGNYTVAGTNATGPSYTGSAEIAFTADECTVNWTIGDGQATGICLVADGVLATSYLSGDALTLVLYQVQPDGVLNGVWSVAGMAGTGTEVLTPK